MTAHLRIQMIRSKILYFIKHMLFVEFNFNEQKNRESVSLKSSKIFYYLLK